MVNNRSIAWRLSILILLSVGVLLVSLIGYSYHSAKKILETELIAKANSIAMTVVAKVEAMARPVEGMAQDLADLLEIRPVAAETAYQLMERLTARNGDVFGMAAVLTPAGGEAGPELVPYIYRTDQGLKRADFGQGKYQYKTSDWYIIPREMKKPAWSEPYFDEGGGDIIMATYSVPVFKGPGRDKVQGVVTADMSLARLSEFLDSLQLGEANYAFIISGQGRFIAHPNQSLLMKESIFSVAEERGDYSLRKLGKKMINGQTGWVVRTSLVSGKSGWVVYAPMPSTGWSLGMFFSYDNLMAKVMELNRTQWLLGAVGAAGLLIVVIVIAGTITRPLRKLEQATRKLAAGDFNAPIPAITGGDEVARLAESFAVMTAEIKKYLELIKQTTASKERIESELRIARSIQMSLIPKNFPPFPEHREFELFALLDPARQVGGDFYDFFFLDAEDEILCLVIGDVSDKGVAAALFMAVTRTLLRSIAKEVQEPAAIISRLNDELAGNNESCMFVTLFCAAFHLPSGQCTYASGGHCPSVVIHLDGRLTKLTEAKGPVVGALAGMAYNEGGLALAPGDLLFLYTDGVTEAANKENNLFGEKRMHQELRRLRNLNVKELLRSMRANLRQFADGAEQSDDITMLGFRYLGPQKFR